MMDRLLALKKPINEYFQQHPQNACKLTSREWTVTNEVCSLLNDVSEATIRMQGLGDTHVSQVMFIMTEIIAMLQEESHPTRVPNATVLPPPQEGIPTESTQVGELTLEAQDVREVLLQEVVMEDKGYGKGLAEGGASVHVAGSEVDQLVNCSAALRTRAEEILKGVIAEFADAQTHPSALVPAPVLDVKPAEPAPKRRRGFRD